MTIAEMRAILDDLLPLPRHYPDVDVRVLIVLSGLLEKVARLERNERAIAYRVACPKCKAEAGTPCVKGERITATRWHFTPTKTPHGVRVRAARERTS